MTPYGGARGERRRHDFQHSGDRRHAHDPGLVQRHKRRHPYGSLTLSGSTLYGMTTYGGANNDGTIFSIPVTGGTPTTLLSFNGTDGEAPRAV